MPNMQTFYSINQATKPIENRIHHDNTTCALGWEIPAKRKRDGTYNYRICDNYAKVNTQGK
jgi:hypothetical protein